MNDVIDTYVPDADWSTVDAAIVRLGAAQGEHDFEVGRWLLAAKRRGVHSRLGFATFSEYVERRLGYAARATTERLRVAGALADLLQLQHALRTGQLHWSAARELVRVVVPDTEARWLEATRHKSVREVERMVKGLHLGDDPDDPKDPALETRVVRLEMAPALFARYRDAVDRMRKDVDASLSDEEAVGALLDRALGGPADEGRAPYQVSLTVCDHCGRTWERSRGEMIEVEAEVGERACCDGQVIGSVPAPDATHVGHAHTPDCTTHVGHARALQTVTPRLRRLVFARAHGRCEVPGCANTRWLEVHHLVPLAAGGPNHASNFALLCSTHHALHHEGRLLIEGTRSTGLRFMHADRTPYGAPPVLPEEAEARMEAEAALRALGVEAAASRRLLAEAVREVGRSAPAPALVLAAMRIRGRGLAVKSAPGDAAYDRPARAAGTYARALRALDGGASVARDRAGRAA